METGLKFQALAHRGLVFAPATKYERVNGPIGPFLRGEFLMDQFFKSKSFSRSSPCCVGLVVRFFGCKMWESQQMQS